MRRGSWTMPSWSASSVYSREEATTGQSRLEETKREAIVCQIGIQASRAGAVLKKRAATSREEASVKVDVKNKQCITQVFQAAGDGGTL